MKFKSFYKGKSTVVLANSFGEAREKAIAFFQAEKAWQVEIVPMFRIKN